MAWFVNHYHHCGTSWEDEWSCCCNDRCPRCNREIEPEGSDDISVIIDRDESGYRVMRSPPTAEDSPDYDYVGETFSTRAEAEAFAKKLETDNAEDAVP